MMLEKRIKNLIILTYQGVFAISPSFPGGPESGVCGSIPRSATNVMERVKVMKQRIFVRLLISSSSKPVFERALDVDNACRVSGPVKMTAAIVVVVEAMTVLAHAVLSIVKA